MLIARQTVSQKIASVQVSVGNTISVSPAGFRGFAGNGNPLTTTQISKVRTLPHVVDVTESLTDRLQASNTSLQSATTFGSLGRRFGGGDGDFEGSGFGQAAINFTPPIQVVGTNNPYQLDQSQGGGALKLTNGTIFSGNSTNNVAIIGTSLASKNNLSVGSNFSAYGKSFSVVGIYNAGNTFANGLMIVPLSTLQTLSGQSGDVTSATVTVDLLANVSSATNAIKSTLGSAADVESSQDASQTAITSLKNIKNISTISLIGATIAGAVIILLTMVMIVRERKHEIGILKAIGASNTRVITQFMSEAVTFTLVAAVIGIIIGVAVGSPITNMLVSDSTSSAASQPIAATGTAFRSRLGEGGGGQAGGFKRPAGNLFERGGNGLHNTLTNIKVNIGWSILAYGFGAAVLIAVVGSALAGGLIAKVRPSEVMRSE